MSIVKTGIFVIFIIIFVISLLTIIIKAIKNSSATKANADIDSIATKVRTEINKQKEEKKDTVNCEYCGSQYSSSELKCPNCGARRKQS